MKITPKNIFVFVIIIFLGWAFYFASMMSYTYPPLKEYSFQMNKTSFERTLINRIDSVGWSIEKTDTTGGNEKRCYWALINYLIEDINIEYDIEYCFNYKDVNKVNNCIEFNIVGAFNFIEKTGGYKASDPGVKELLEYFENNILNGLAPDCKE